MELPRNVFPQLAFRRVEEAHARLRKQLWLFDLELEVEGSRVFDSFLPPERAPSLEFRPVARGETFGPAGGGWAQRWFRLDLPAGGAGRALFWQCQGEATAYIDGEAWAGLDVAHAYCPAPERACRVYLDAGTYQSGIWTGPHPLDPLHGCRFDRAWLARRNPELWEPFWDLDAFARLLRLRWSEEGFARPKNVRHAAPLESASPLLRRLLCDLEAACDLLDRGEIGEFAAALKTMLAGYRGGSFEGRAGLVGYAHIDLVWLWPEAVTHRKAVHTFSTALRLMERYPEFRFLQSQPFLNRRLAASHPGLHRAILDRAASGRWELTGATQVECDVNLPAGESLAMAFRLGQRSFEELRGERSRLLWIPDVFGYGQCLPQLMRLAGVDRFFTTKLTWSSVTRFPYTSFVWKGGDGSEVLTQLCATGYNGELDPAETAAAVRANREGGVFDAMLLPQGYGDGGGGVTEEICERARRMADLAGLPKTNWTKAEDFFDELEKKRAELPRFQGELYLEYHRGTFTTQGEYKRRFRAAEKALQAEEAAAALTGRLDRAGLRERWERLMLGMFHDAIPGSSIGLVYRELEAELERLAGDSLAAAAGSLSGAAAGPSIVFNPSPLAFDGLVGLPAGIEAPAGAPVQAAHDHGRLISIAMAGPSASPLTEALKRGPRSKLEASPGRLANQRLRAEFSQDGRLVSLEFKSENGDWSRGLFDSGFMLYEDRPHAFDAWEIERHAFGLGVPMPAAGALSVLESGPLRAALGANGRLGNGSSFSLRYLLEADAPALRIELEIDWKEDHRLLRFEAATEYLARHARFGGSFGSVLRQQLAGLPSEEAQWETPAQRWAAVYHEGEAEGLALIAEAKYGFSAREGRLGLSLLRAPGEPDPAADRRRHLIRFALAPYGAGRPNPARLAESMYNPPLFIPGDRPAPAPFVLDGPDTLVAAALKPAENGRGLVLRLHESLGRPGAARIGFRRAEGAQAAAAFKVNLLEERLAALERTGEADAVFDWFKLPYRAYEIITVKAEDA